MTTRSAAVLALLIGLAGCSTRYEHNDLSGAASMRVEVEVYKGPLSIGPEMQIGEMTAALRQAEIAMNRWLWYADGVAKTCAPASSQDCSALQSAVADAQDIAALLDVIVSTGETVKQPDSTKMLAELERRAQKSDANTADRDRLEFARQCSRVDNPARLSVRSTKYEMSCYHEVTVRRIAEVSAALAASAQRTARATVRSVPGNREVRTAIVTFADIAAEYARQLQARLTVLEKELAHPDSDRKLYPTSDYLRGARPTDFVHLYDWLDASKGNTAPYGGGKLDVQDRVRLAERLIGDNFWEKVNEVYSSGQGDVSMAFVKDELGNWNLKSFSNDPSDLLAAYRKASFAVIKAATKAAQAAASGGGTAAASSLLGLANQLATGEGTAPTSPGMDAAALHARAVKRLGERRTMMVAKDAALLAAVNALTNDLAAKTADAASKELSATQADDRLKGARDSRAGCDASTTCDAAERARLESEMASRQQEYGAARSNAEAARTAAKQADIDLKVAIQRRADLPKDAAQAVREVLDDQLAVIAALQEGVAGVAPVAAPPVSSRLPAVPALPAIPR